MKNDSLLNLFELASDFGEDPVAEELSSSTSTGGSRGYAYYRGMRIRLSHSVINVVDSKPLTEFQDLFEELGYGMGQDEITEWLQSDVSDSGVH